MTVTRPTSPKHPPELRRLRSRTATGSTSSCSTVRIRFSAAAHRGQKRMSGEEFVSHSIAVATILIGQFLDSTSIVAALLHDVVEDADVRGEDIAQEFGAEVAGLVDGLTKIAHLTFRSTAEEQVENYRKLLLSIAKDARVIIIKLADRLHNMRPSSICRPTSGRGSPPRRARSTPRWRTGSAWRGQGRAGRPRPSSS
jgi:(p)ppGpp synthase/HD superfamily hydrolase